MAPARPRAYNRSSHSRTAHSKRTRKKGLGLLAIDYGNVYVAEIALGADNAQAVKALAEAQSYKGPSLIIAYSHCIEHGLELEHGMEHQKAAVDCGYWPLYRYDPRKERPFQLDSRPKKPIADFLASENRFSVLQRRQPELARELDELEQQDVDERWRLYRALAELGQGASEPTATSTADTVDSGGVRKSGPTCRDPKRSPSETVNDRILGAPVRYRGKPWIPVGRYTR